MRVAAAISPRATSPADTEPMKIDARPVDSVIAAARAPCRVKCSVVTNAVAADRGSAPPAPLLVFWSLLVVSPAFRRRSGRDYHSSHEGAGACLWSLPGAARIHRPQHPPRPGDGRLRQGADEPDQRHPAHRRVANLLVSRSPIPPGSWC